MQFERHFSRREPKDRWHPVWALLFAMVLLGGCIIIPIGAPKGELTEEEIYSVDVGNTRAEVEAIFGPGTMSSDRIVS